ncbi:MAG: acyl-CoA dehydrogenase family protein [Chloroflexi bacterium]|nr:acyl-CoA dehydrogenase family protein [Chloroflexota bacterium]
MDLRFTPQEEAFRQDVQTYLAANVTPELLRELEEGETMESRGPLFRAFIRKMGSDGWLGIGWPKEFGGQGRSWAEQFIFFEEMWYRGVPPFTFPLMTIASVGPTLIRVGTEWQKREFLPRILRGEIEFALGYTEPGAGNDLASLQTRAVRDGDDYIINGQKVFTSNAHSADYVWLAARTDPNLPKHKGISIFLVDTRLPGYSFQPLHTWADLTTNVTFYDNVRVPVRCLVGEENRGWEYITTALNYERVAMGPVSWLQRDLEDLIRWARETEWSGKPVSQDPWVQDTLADLVVQLEIARLFAYRNVALMCEGKVPYVEASIAKVHYSELCLRVANVGLQLMGMYGLLEPGSKWAPLKGRIEQAYRFNTIGTFAPGANEVHRDIIGMKALGLPRA